MPLSPNPLILILTFNMWGCYAMYLRVTIEAFCYSIISLFTN